MATQVTPVEGLLVRAGMYQMLALGYAYPDHPQQQRVQELAADLAPWVALIHPTWQDRMGDLRKDLGADAQPELEADFNRLFSGAIACAPYETAYEPDVFRKQHALADMAGFYQAFGFQLPDGSRWPPDHVGVQLEFCAILLQRMAQALEQGWHEQAEVCDDALRKFLVDHLGRWCQAFAGDLDRLAETPGYRQLAGATAEWVASEITALGLAPDFLRSRKVYADDADVPTCGGCTVCGPEGPAAVPAAGTCPLGPA